MEIRQSRVVIRARNFDHACRFYGETLALPRLTSWDSEEGRGARYQAGPGILEILGRPHGERPDLADEAFDYQGPMHKLTVSLVVPSAEAAYQELIFRDKNIPGGLRQTAGGQLVFETHDPDGVKILFVEEEAQS